MAIEEARRFNPPEGQAAQAFDVVNQLAQDATIESLQALSDQQRRLVLGSYLKAGLAYFANLSGDEYLEELGTTCLQAIEERQIEVVLARDTHTAIDEMDIPVAQKLRLQNSFDKQEMLFLKNEKYVGIGITEPGTFVLPLGFVLEAQRDPIKGLMKLSSFMSQMQDFLNERSDGSTMFTAKAKMEATKAHFLRHVQGKTPGLEFSYEDRALLSRYPEGPALSGLRRLQARRQYSRNF